nr:hypothetical protein [Tanacetum cinerariifolium]
MASIDGLNAILENVSWFIRNNPLILKKWNPDVNLLKEDVGNDLIWVKLHGVSVMAFNEDNLSVIATKLGTPLMFDSYTSDTCMQSWDECPNNIGSNVAKNLKKLSQAPRGVSVGPKVGFKPVKQVYRHVSKKINANNSCNKKKEVESRKKANSSGSSFWNVGSSSISTTPIVKKIDKLERLIIDEKLTLVDDEGKPLEKVDYPGDRDSEDEVKLVDNEMASFLASKRVDYGTNRLLEYWKKTYENADYDYDPYDDDMYVGREIHEIIQYMCDNLDIKVRGRKKK